MKINLFKILILIGSLIWVGSTHAAAVNITIDPVAYDGPWIIPGKTTVLSGSHVVSLETDSTYALRVANNGRGQFYIDIDMNGVVSSRNTDAATGNASTLTFKNTTVNVDPVAYTGPYRIVEMADVPTGYHSCASARGGLFDSYR
jgi:hypothetical protein